MAEPAESGGPAGARVRGRAAARSASSTPPPPLPIARLAMAGWLVAAAAACSPSSSTPLSVFAAAGAKPAVDELVGVFRRERGAEIEVSYGGGGQVLARMVFLERGDVYIAPEQGFMRDAVERRAVEAETIRDLAYLVPVLAVRKENPKRVETLSDLTRPGVRVAVARPETTCLGEYSPQIFRRAGLAGPIGANVVAQAPRPDLLVTWLVLGEVDAIITWHFYGELARGEIEAIWLPPELLTGIGRMQAAVATYSEDADRARGFVDFLTSIDARDVFEKHGYIVEARQLAKHWPGSGTGSGDPPGPGPRTQP